MRGDGMSFKYRRTHSDRKPASFSPKSLSGTPKQLQEQSKKRKRCKEPGHGSGNTSSISESTDPNSPANRLYTGTSEAEESAVLYKALDSRPGRRKQRLNTDTLVYQLVINITAELNQFGTTEASLTGSERTIPPFWD